jgi:hypothetical protein
MSPAISGNDRAGIERIRSPRALEPAARVAIKTTRKSVRHRLLHIHRIENVLSAVRVESFPWRDFGLPISLRWRFPSTSRRDGVAKIGRKSARTKTDTVGRIGRDGACRRGEES